jgi:hypothetical protein
MNFKVFVTVFIGLLAVNVSVQSPTVKDDTVKAIVVEIVDAILTVTNSALTDASALVDEIETNQAGVKDYIVGVFDKIGKDANAMILGVIDELRTGATADGNAIIDCIDAEQDKTEAAVSQVFDNLGTCVFDEQPKILDEARAIISQLTDLQVDVQGQTDALSACTDAELTCLAAYGVTLVATLQKIPPIVVSDIQDIIALVKTITADVAVCNGDMVKNLGAAAQDIFNEAVVCIKA